jgi:hypothetical protein
VALAEVANPRDDAVARTCDRQRAFVAEALAQSRQVAPVAVDEAAVSPARPEAALLCFEHDHRQVRVALLQGQRRPEPGVAAADDRDVGLELALERRRRLGPAF